MEKIFCVYGKIPKRMEDGNIRLRPLIISDGPSVNTGLRNVDILRASGLTGPVLKSRLSAWWWLKKTYVLLYCIEVDSSCIGFVGLYNLKPDRSAEMTLVIFDSKNRRTGYGTKVFNLFTQVIKKYFLKIIVRVRTDNYASIAFWSKLGFKETGDPDGIKVMSMDLKSDG
jgi:hypothetical protein